MEPVAWTTLGLTILVSAPLARRHPRARLIGRWAVGVLFLGAGALINLVYLVGDTDYAGFADASYLPFVREAWRSIVAPRQVLFIGLLVVFEALVGVLVLSGGRRTQAGLLAGIAFHVALLSFGWFFYAWSLPMVAALALLLRAEHLAAGAEGRECSSGGSVSMTRRAERGRDDVAESALPVTEPSAPRRVSWTGRLISGRRPGTRRGGAAAG